MKSATSTRLKDAVVGILHDTLSVNGPVDWNAREERIWEAYNEVLSATGTIAARESVFLGGDILRPYIQAPSPDGILVAFRVDVGLSLPKLIQDLMDDPVRAPWEVRAHQESSYLVWEFEHASNKRPNPVHGLPNVYLTTLTNATRYQTRRYPLNIARLAQWLRFQHSARVRPTDLALDYGGQIDLLITDIVQSRPDVLGVSLNFGELTTLRTLVSALRSAELRPVIGLGNVLAAWNRREVEEICRDYPLFISQSYGEGDLEEVCRFLSLDSATDRLKPARWFYLRQRGAHQQL
jgi:hypothetical protein